MTFKEYNQSQSFLLPPKYEDFLGESHESIILSEFIDELNTTKLVQSYRNQNGGSSAYHPVMLLKVLIYGYMNGVFSSRKISKLLKQDLAFMYLAGKNTPDFRTLSRFRKDKGEYLEDIFSQVTDKAYNLGLIKFGICSLDGTKIYANACKAKNYCQKDLKEKMRGYIEQAEKIDQMEDEMYGDNEDDTDPDLKTKKGREKRKKELQKKQKEAEAKLQEITISDPAKATTKINTTDSDSRFMQMKRKDYANGYNVQSVTENGIILSSSISNASNDSNALIPTLKKLQSKHRYPKKLLADKGYCSEDNYAFCEDNNIDAYIPVHKEQVDISQYTYDKKTDTYTDLEGRKYLFKQYKNRRDGKRQRGRPKKTETQDQKLQLYKTVQYEHVNNETQKKKYLHISPEWLHHVKKQKEKLCSALGKEIYKQRMYDVEGVFANIKKNLNFTRFNLRGFVGVTNEWNLITLAHNIKKIASI